MSQASPVTRPCPEWLADPKLCNLPEKMKDRFGQCDEASGLCEVYFYSNFLNLTCICPPGFQNDPVREKDGVYCSLELAIPRNPATDGSPNTIPVNDSVDSVDSSAPTSWLGHLVSFENTSHSLIAFFVLLILISLSILACIGISARLRRRTSIRPIY